MNKPPPPPIRNPPSEIELDIANVFSSPAGQRVLDHLMNRGAKYVQIDKRPTPTYPNAAFLNPNAALYRAGMDDTVRYLKRMIEKVNRVGDERAMSEQIIDAVKRGDETI